MSVLFVCTGNTCRSPMAAAIARRLGLEASSAGADVHEDRATQHAIALVPELASHTPEPLNPDIVAAADVVVALGETARAEVAELGGRAEAIAVADPYGGTLDDYRRTYDELERAIRTRFGS